MAEAVDGIGGVFFRSRDPGRAPRVVRRAPRHRHGGLRHRLHGDGGRPDRLGAVSRRHRRTSAEREQQLMVNFRVRDLDAMLGAAPRSRRRGRRARATRSSSAASAGRSIPRETASSSGSPHERASRPRRRAAPAAARGGAEEAQGLRPPRADALHRFVARLPEALRARTATSTRHGWRSRPSGRCCRCSRAPRARSSCGTSSR